jgi:hypothetical protein
MRITRAFGLVALVAGLSLVVAAPASAHFHRHARGISGGFIPDTGPPFTAVTGKVTSPKAACRAAAKVSLWKTAPGPDVNQGFATTPGNGSFTIGSPGAQFEDGAYYLVVKRKNLLRNRFHRHFCPRLQTNAFTITNP